jgi:hypothetical protein
LFTRENAYYIDYTLFSMGMGWTKELLLYEIMKRKLQQKVLEHQQIEIEKKVYNFHSSCQSIYSVGVS